MAEMTTVEPKSRTPGRGRIWLAAAAPPAVWVLQGAIGWFIADEACPSTAEPLSLSTARIIIGVVTLVALVVSVGGIVAAQRIWRSLTAPDAQGLVSANVSERVRFVATIGLVVAVTLTLGLVMAGLPSIMIHHCGETR